jgi:hypothetical protein
MKKWKQPLVPVCVVLSTLSACNSSTSTPSSNTPASSSNSGSQSAPTPQQQIAQNFTAVSDDGSWLHNPAFRDASGNLWSEVVTNLDPSAFGKDVKTAEQISEQACNEIGATLPTIDQLNQLAKYLGRDSAIGFHPEFVQDPIPGVGALYWDFKDDTLFSSSISNGGTSISAIDGDDGNNESVDLASATIKTPAALCVFPALRSALVCTLKTTTANGSSACGKIFSGETPAYYTVGLPNSTVQVHLAFSAPDTNANTSTDLQFDDAATQSALMVSNGSTNITGNNTSETGSISATDPKNGDSYVLTCSSTGLDPNPSAAALPPICQ